MKGYYTEENKYLLKSVIPCFFVDADFRLKPTSFMDMAQEMAYLAANEKGFGYDALMEKGTVWVLCRMNIKFLKYPEWRDEVIMTTWHKGPSGPFFLRDFILASAEGEPLVRATSSWVVMDVNSRRLCRAEDIVGGDTSCPDHAVETPAGKVILPKGIEPENVGSHVVRYSDVDLLGHTNNVRYLVWALDRIDLDELRAHPVKEVSINFNHEVRPGETVELGRVRVENPEGVTYYFEGKTGGRQAFSVKIDI